MTYRQATIYDAQAITDVVQAAIKKVYPDFYAKEIVDAFLNLHCIQNVTQDIKDGLTFVAQVGGKTVGTGTIEDRRHITRVYVLPQLQNKGIGSLIMKNLEDKIKADGFDKAILDASAPAFEFYLKRGYIQKETGKYKVTDEITLTYEIMEKFL